MHPYMNVSGVCMHVWYVYFSSYLIVQISGIINIQEF